MVARSNALLPVAGALVWAVHFAVIYGITSWLCARGAATMQWLGIGIVTWSVGIATMMALAALAALFFSARHARGFLSWITAGVAALAALAIVWEALPAFMVPPCQ